MHRTGADWVAENKDMIGASRSPTFDPMVMILKGEVLRTISTEDGFTSPATARDGKYRDGVSRVLSLASGCDLRDTAQRNIRTAIQALDRLNREVSSLQKGFVLGFTIKVSTPTSRHPREIRYINFLSAALQIPIVPYVKWKAEHEPRAFINSTPITGNSSNTPVQVLESWIFGHWEQGRAYEDRHVLKEEEEQRLDILETILRHVDFQQRDLQSLRLSLDLPPAPLNKWVFVPSYGKYSALVDRYLLDTRRTGCLDLIRRLFGVR